LSTKHFFEEDAQINEIVSLQKDWYAKGIEVSVPEQI